MSQVHILGWKVHNLSLYIASICDISNFPILCSNAAKFSNFDCYVFYQKNVWCWWYILPINIVVTNIASDHIGDILDICCMKVVLQLQKWTEQVSDIFSSVRRIANIEKTWADEKQNVYDVKKVETAASSSSKWKLIMGVCREVWCQKQLKK